MFFCDGIGSSLDKRFGWIKKRIGKFAFPILFVFLICRLSATDASRQSQSPIASRLFFFISAFFS